MLAYSIDSNTEYTQKLKTQTVVRIPSLLRDIKFTFSAPVKYEIVSKSGCYLLLFFDYSMTDDNRMLVLFDLKNKKECFRIHDFSYSYQETFYFNEDESYIVCYAGICDIYIDFNGDVTNEKDFFQACIENHYQVDEYIIDKFIKLCGNNKNNWLKVISSLNATINTHLSQGIGDNEMTMEYYYQLQGKAYEKLKNLFGARH